MVIETDTHKIDITPEEFCDREGGCLDIQIAPETPKYGDLLNFDYHVNYFSGIVEVGVGGRIQSINSGIPGGGSIDIQAASNRIEDYDPDDPAFTEELNWGRLSNFIMDQAAQLAEKLLENHQYLPKRPASPKRSEASR